MIKLPEKVNFILNTLIDAGYEAYAVGGCVRDSLLHRVPDDWDITTSAKPEEVKALFRRTIDTGIQHGTVTVMMAKEGFEVTTYRIDGEYEDSRHPKEVIFTDNLIEDLKRRDFTINAMAYNDRRGLVDEFGGKDDLNKGVVRAVGNPEERFTEDALRIMRAVRFAAQLGYQIEENTAAAAKALAPRLQNISAERIQTELVKLMVSNHPEELVTAYHMGITKEILPEFDKMMETTQQNPHHCYTVGLHTIHAVCSIKNEAYPDQKLLKALRLGLLFHDCGKPDSKSTDEEGIDHFYGHPVRSEELATAALRRLKFDNDTIRTVKAICRYHDIKPKLTPAGVRKAINMTGMSVFELLFSVQRADILAQSDYKREEKLFTLKKMQELYSEIIDRGDPLFLKDLAVNGTDLMENQITGKQIGETLNDLLSKVLEHPEWNERELLLEKVRTHLQGSE